MIRITRPAKTPASLIRSAPKATQKHCDAYEANPADYDSGKVTFKFSKIYGSAVVKGALMKAQHTKCFLCESKIPHITYGTVEHMRPKGGFKQEESDDLGRPGYYWLAYEWTNLLLACDICNEQFKKNHYPLFNPAKRARNHHHSIDSEKPVLIDPTSEDPSRFLGFREEFAYAKNGNRRGKLVVPWLNRDELVEVRRDALGTAQVLKTMRAVLVKLRRTVTSPAEIQEVDDKLLEIDRGIARLIALESQYSAMMRDLFEAP